MVISIVVGTLNATLSSTDSTFQNNTITVPAASTKTLDLKLTNNNRDAKFNFYYKEPLKEGVVVSYTGDLKDIPPLEEGIVIKKGESREYNLEVKNSTKEAVSITFGSDAVLADKPLAFTFGDKELSGIWVGKFETGSINGDSLGDVTTNNLVAIKPNITPWRNIRVSTLDFVSRRLTISGNIYGFDATYNSHAAKNSEWALVSYLTQSKYGKYGNSMYSSANKEIYINNYNGYKTGCSSGVPNTGTSSTKAYTKEEAQQLPGHSTETNNIQGPLNSGYTGMCGYDGREWTGRNWPNAQYYDVYTTESIMTACNGEPCQGHALNEVAGWYNDSSYMVNAIYPWSLRGGVYNSGSNAGVFYFDLKGGHATNNYSFRIVLTP